MNIGKRLRLAIEASGSSQKKVTDFSLSTGIPYVTLQQYLSDKRSPNTEALTKICVQTNLNIHWLLTGQGTMYRDSDTVYHADDITTDVAELILKCSDLVQEQCKLAGFDMAQDLRHKLAIGMAHAVIKEVGLDFEKAREFLKRLAHVSIEHQRASLEQIK